MQTFLITGSNEEGRMQKFEELSEKTLTELKISPDFFLLSITENLASIGIEQVRNLQQKILYKPFAEEKKVILIREAQNLTVEAQNSLLKTLEEPPPDTQIFLTALETTFLLPTIVSRCQVNHLAPAKEILIDESEETRLVNLIDDLLTSSVGKRFKIIEKEGIAKDRTSAVDWFNKLTIVVRQLILSSYQIPDTPPVPSSPDILISQYLNILHLINKSKKYLDTNCNVKLTIDNFLLDLPSKNG